MIASIILLVIHITYIIILTRLFPPEKEGPSYNWRFAGITAMVVLLGILVSYFGVEYFYWGKYFQSLAFSMFFWGVYIVSLLVVIGLLLSRIIGRLNPKDTELELDQVPQSVARSPRFWILAQTTWWGMAMAHGLFVYYFDGVFQPYVMAAVCVGAMLTSGVIGYQIKKETKFLPKNGDLVSSGIYFRKRGGRGFLGLGGGWSAWGGGGYSDGGSGGNGAGGFGGFSGGDFGGGGADGGW